MKRVGKRQYSRAPLERMLIIFRRVKERAEKEEKWPNAVTLAAELHVTIRTVKRDIDFMRDRYGVKLAYDEIKHGYYLTEPMEQFPVAAMSEAEMFALLVADKAIAQYNGTPFQKPLRMAFQKLTGQLDDRERYSLENLGLALSFRPFAPEDADMSAFRVITRALAQRLELTFEYRNLAAKKVLQRQVRPYHLACIDNHWYLFAYDTLRGDIRTFALTRLAKPALTKKRFVRAKSFNPDKYLAGSFGVLKGEEAHEVEIEFDAWATDLLQGRTWHTSQEVTPLPEGGSRMRFHLSSLDEVERWILSWGDHARVLGPAALQQRVRKTALAIAAQYAGEG
jgi:proteasome accessory factor B